MAERQLSDVPDILEDNLFDSGMNISIFANGRFRDIASLLLRNAVSKSIIHIEDRNPADTDQVAGLTQYWLNTETFSSFVSKAGEDWIEIVGSSLTGPQIVALIAALTGDARLSYSSLKDKPTIPQIPDPLTGLQIVGLIAALTGDDRLSYSSLKDKPTIPQIPEIPDPLTGLQIVGLIAALTGNDRLSYNSLKDKPDTSGGLSSVATDDTIQGDGTSGSPLGVVDNTPAGEIGRIFLVGNYTFGASSTPVSQNLGYTGGNLYVHATASDGDKSTVLEGLSQGDYFFIGSTILEITGAPSSASSIHTFPVTLLEGEVPTSGSHTLYYITERRAIIAGAIHLFHLAFGTPNGFLGYDGTGAAVVKDNPLSDLEIGKPTLLGRWEKRNTNGGTSGTFQPLQSSSSSPQLYFHPTDDDGTDRSAALSALGKGDSIFVEGFNVLRLTRAAVVNQGGSIDFYGEWADDYSTRSAPSNGATVNIYRFSKGSSVGTTPIEDNLLAFSSTFELKSVSPQGGQQDESDSSESMDIDSGIYSVLGNWERGSASLPDTGDYYTEATSVVLNPTDNDGTARESVIETLGVGDRIQFDAINAFILSAVPVAVNGWSMSGAWVNTWDAADFNGVSTLYVIKKNNIVVRNNVKKGRYLQIGNGLDIIAADPADSFETIWEGSLTSSTTDRQILNAGKKFSDYTHIIFNYSGINRRNLWEVPVSIWDTINSVEIHNRDAHLAFTHRSDTEFDVVAGLAGITLYRIYGYKGV